MIFLGLEISSIATYVLAGYRRSDIKSNESAIKYFVLGSFATAFLLYGMALIYGATGTTNLEQIKNAVSNNFNAATNQTLPIELLFIGAALMLIGFGFKIATAPFHFWTPDVYDGAPTPVTAFMAAGPKAAGFAAFLRVFVLTFSIGYSTDLHVVWASSLESIAILTMIVGNIAAISQTNLKRMLAYSSIAHAGYALVGFLADDWTSVAFYMLTYSVMNMGSFAIVELFSGRDGKTDLDSYAGFGFKNLGISIAMLVFMLSLAGVPLTGGFMGKFMLFRAAWDKGLHTLVIVAVLNSAVSVYYYLRPMVVMFFRESNDSSISIPAIPKSLIAVIVISLIGTLYLGILPGKIMELLENSRQLITLVN
ncbi:MAG: NADH-quinone oxidoreductase subunit N, partial [Blastocatellia bacterium]|nr:NADH-quinone oxidoreductase subunit N [Blastocatellia bacterium]